MPRPSRGHDEALLAAGRALFPAVGCAGLTVRAVAEHAGVNPAMLHYHFGSKDAFLEALLQGLYEEMFTRLSGQATAAGPAIERLRGGLLAMARFAREQRELLARLWMDALAHEPVAVAFFCRNGPRHLGVLLKLLDEAAADGTVAARPALQRLAFTLGSVVLPVVFIAGLAEAAAMPGLPRRVVQDQLLGDEALAERVDLALAALGVPLTSNAGLTGAAGTSPTTAASKGPSATPSSPPHSSRQASGRTRPAPRQGTRR